MNIVFFVDRFPPSTGGVEQSTWHTAHALAAKGHRLTVVTEHEASRSDERLPSGVTVIRFQRPFARPFTRFMYWKLMLSMRSLFRDADVLHFHDYHTLLDWFGPLRLLLRRPVYAVTFHGFEGWPIRLRHHLLRHIAARLAHVRFGVGEYLREWYGHPVDQVFIGAPVCTPPATPPKGHRVDLCYVGRLEADTGILDVLGTLRNAGVVGRRTIVLAGEGSLRNRIAALSTERFTIELRGVVHDPSELIVSSRVVIATGFLSTLNAWALGVPVLFPAFTEIKRSYIRSIPDASSLAWIAESPEECAAYAEEILRGSAEAERRRTAASAFVSALSWHDIAGLHEEHYAQANDADTAF
jgi:glycosyltransferase involved in cell wall biosynthesis